MNCRTKAANITLAKLAAVEHSARIDIRVPASSANVGPGFDTFALALGIHTQFQFHLLAKPDDKIPFLSLTPDTDQAWFQAKVLLDICLAPVMRLHPMWENCLKVVVDSKVPIGKGLGSSAVALVGVLWACQRLAQQNADRGVILRQAAEIEGHPDNAAASLYGGFVIAGQSHHGKMVNLVKLEWPSAWRLLLVVPAVALSTAKARSVLPKMVKRADAVTNLQHASLLVSAIYERNEDLLKESLADRLHEPYRAQLVEELPALQKLLKTSPALGCVLSGAGSSVMVLVNEKHRLEVIERIQHWIDRTAVRPSLFDVGADHLGLEELDL